MAFTTKEQDYIKYGENKYNFFVRDVEEAFTNNQFNDHYYIYSEPGYGKTFQTQAATGKHGITPLMFEGSMGLFAFAADIAFALTHAPKGNSKIVAVIDDCDSLFNKGDNINTLKGMLDPARNSLTWGKALTGAILSALDEDQLEALMRFKVPGKSGFSIPTDRFTFMALSNRPLASSKDIEEATPSKAQEYKDQNAIRRRVQYKDLTMENEVRWGYVSYVTLNYKLAEKFMPSITQDQKEYLLKWCAPGARWDRISDKNLSLVEKMVKDMVRYPNEFEDKWEADYLV
jgi:hypothetical protein